MPVEGSKRKVPLGSSSKSKAAGTSLVLNIWKVWKTASPTTQGGTYSVCVAAPPPKEVCTLGWKDCASRKVWPVTLSERNCGGVKDFSSTRRKERFVLGATYASSSWK